MTTISVWTDSNFEAALEAADGLCLVDVWAPRCGPCKVQAETTRKVAAERPSWRVARVDGQANPRFAERFGVRAVPTLLLLVGGEVVERLMGPHSAAELTQALDRLAPPATQRLAS